MELLLHLPMNQINDNSLELNTWSVLRFSSCLTIVWFGLFKPGSREVCMCYWECLLWLFFKKKNKVGCIQIQFTYSGIHSSPQLPPCNHAHSQTTDHNPTRCRLSLCSQYPSPTPNPWKWLMWFGSHSSTFPRMSWKGSHIQHKCLIPHSPLA